MGAFSQQPNGTGSKDREMVFCVWVEIQVPNERDTSQGQRPGFKVLFLLFVNLHSSGQFDSSAIFSSSLGMNLPFPPSQKEVP